MSELAPETLSKQDVIARLGAHGITPTQQRIAIGKLLFARPQHLSADQLLGMVNDDESLVSKATVYNTLNLFARSGLVREVIVDPDRVFYDSNTEPHQHVYNVDTGVLTDWSLPEVQIASVPHLPADTTVVGIDVVLRVRNIV